MRFVERGGFPSAEVCLGLGSQSCAVCRGAERCRGCDGRGSHCGGVGRVVCRGVDPGGARELSMAFMTMNDMMEVGP